MIGHLAIVAYRSLVAGLASSTVDLQVRWFAVEDEDEVRRIIEAEPASGYLNPNGETVLREFSGILAIEKFDPGKALDHGEEMIGFIASTEELTDLA